MKILAFTDLHGKRETIKNIIKKTINEKPDILVCAGDLSDFGRHIDRIAANLNSLKKTILMIPGNHESEEEIIRVAGDNENIIDIHKSSYEIDDYIFLGYGGGGFGRKDIRFEKISQDLKKSIKKGKKIIFVTHAPIYNTKLDQLNSRHLGNENTRKFIEEVHPDLVICGHFHENKQIIDYIGKTKIINPGYDGLIINI